MHKPKQLSILYCLHSCLVSLTENIKSMLTEITHICCRHFLLSLNLCKYSMHFVLWFSYYLGPRNSLTRPLGNSVSFGDGGGRMKRREGNKKRIEAPESWAAFTCTNILKLNQLSHSVRSATRVMSRSAWTSVDSEDARQSSQRS